MEIMLGIGEKLVAILKIEIVDLYEELMTEACFLPACRLVSFASSALEAAYAYVSGLGRWVKV